MDVGEREEILSDALGSLFAIPQVSSPSSPYLHARTGVRVSPPDTDARNWALHASSVWVAAIFLTDHLDDLRGILSSAHRVLELGAGAGLPGIALASASKARGDDLQVWLSDYPDQHIMDTLSQNININTVANCCRVAGHAWGTSTFQPREHRPDFNFGHAFDLIIAADTLWNPEMHQPFCQTLNSCLGLDNCARVVLVAGMHTGRYAIRGFLKTAAASGFDVAELRERRVCSESELPQDVQDRPWVVERPEEEDAAECRRWVIWIVLKRRNPG